MSIELSDKQRQTIGNIAATIFPGHEQQPSAAEIDLHMKSVDKVFHSRPDLLDPFLHLIEDCQDDESEFLANLGDSEFSLVMTVIAAAYVMDRDVMRALGYDGQQALTPSRGGFGCEELVMDMMQGPKIFRR